MAEELRWVLIPRPPPEPIVATRAREEAIDSVAEEWGLTRGELEHHMRMMDWSFYDIIRVFYA